MIWIIILVALVVLAAIPVIPAFQLSSYILLPGGIKPIDPKCIPDEQVDALIEAESWLSGQGFVRVAHVSRGPVIKGQSWGLMGVTAYNAACNTWVLVYAEPQKHPVFNWRMVLMTPLDDNTYIATVSGSEFTLSLEQLGIISTDAMAVSPLEQLHCHQQKITDGCSRQVKLEDICEVLELSFFQGLVDIGLLRPVREGYGLPFSHSFRTVIRLYRVTRQLSTQIDKAAAPAEVTPEAQVAAYQVHKSIAANNNKAAVSKTSLLLVSVLLFGISFGVMFSWTTMLLLLLVLFIHEAGHLLGMWMFGYRDLRMLFIPFMGALASGKKDQARAWQEAVVLLMGPLPGYILGLALLTMSSEGIPEWVIEFALMSIILNALNLLPIMPLDGGRLVNMALFNRFPRLQFAMLIASIAALAYVGLVWGEVAGVVIATLLIIALPSQWRESRLLSFLITQGAHKESSTSLALITRLSKNEQWRKLSPPIQWPLLDSLSERVRHANSGIVLSLGIFLLWFSSIFVPPATFMGEESRSNIVEVAALLWGSDVGSLSNEELIEQLNESEDDTERLRLSLDLSYRLYGQDKAGSDYYWQMAELLVKAVETSAVERARYFREMANFCSRTHLECELDYLWAAKDRFDVSEGVAGERVAIYVSLASSDELPNEQRLELVDSAEAALESLDGQEGFWEDTFDSIRAEVYEQLGEMDTAELYFLKIVARSGSREGYIDQQPRFALVDFYYRQGRQVDAALKLEQWIDEQAGTDGEYVSLAYDSLVYRSAWLLLELEPEQAKIDLQQAKAVSSVDQIELRLAQFLVDQQLGGADKNKLIADLNLLLDEVEDDYQWAPLASWIALGQGRDKPFDSGSAGGGLARQWYGRLAILIDDPDLGFIKGKIASQQSLWLEGNASG